MIDRRFKPMGMRLLVAIWFCVAGIAIGKAVPVERVSVDANGRERPARSAEPAISADGRVIAFSSTGRFTVDPNGRPDVFVKDRANGALERISDDRGGDQPSISADGTFVVYRSLEDLPKVRKYDRRAGGPRNSISFPFGGAQSRRFGDGGLITPNGAWTTYLFRPEPANGAQSGNLVNRHSTLGGASFAAQEILGSGLRDAFRAASNNAGTFAVWVSSEPFGAGDTNEMSDVFIANSVSTRALSALPGNVSAPQRSFDVAFSADGTRVVFLSEAALLPADTDNRASLYFATSADGFNAIQFLPTTARPVALGPQAASAVDTIAFAGADNTGRIGVHLANFSGTSVAMTPAPVIIGAPALSADGSTVAFVTRAALGSSDRNGTDDVYVADVSSLLGNPRREPPIPVFTNVSEGQRINANQNFSVSTTATDPSGTIAEIALELDGRLIGRGNGASLSRLINVPPGTYRLTARAFNDALVANETSITIIAIPPSGARGLSGAADVTTEPLADGSLLWKGKVRVENRTASARNFRVSLTIAPTPAIIGPNETPADGPGFSDVRVLPAREERVSFVSEIINVAANSSALVDAEALLPPPEIIGNGLQGIAWTLLGILTEELAGGPVAVTRQTLFTHAPVLSEKTNGPNGGATNTGNPLADGAFTPPAITSFALNLPASVRERTTSTLSATATFSNSTTKPCFPVWQIIAGNSAARITASGVLTTLDVKVVSQVRIRATLAGLAPVEGSLVVTPVVPTVAIVAVDKTAVENGDPARFRIQRSGGLQDAVTIPFAVAGTAAEISNFAAIERSVTLSAGVSRAFIDILPVDNSQFAGTKTVTLTLEPGSDYRLGFARAATIRILDDEPPLARQADLVLRAGGRRIGADVYETASPLFPLTQILTRPARAGTTIATQLEVTHRGTEPAEFILRGAPSATGFLARYLDRAADVTAAASTGGTDGGYHFTLQPGERKVITMRITTTAEAPPGFVQRLPVDLREASGDPALAIPDAAEVLVIRR